MALVFSPAIAVASTYQDDATQDSPSAKLRLLPEAFELRGPDSRQRLLLHKVVNQELGQQLQKEVEWKSSDESVVRIEDGVAIPVGDGSTTVTASFGDQQATANIEVRDFENPAPRSFTNDVLPVFSRQGCNSGACHGALAGKGGFRLSLRGYDPISDHHNITKQARGRRVELAAPGRSLLLTKPTGAVPHKGGVKFDIDDLDYKLIADWLSQGAVASPSDEPVVERIEVQPALATAFVGDVQRVYVLAHFSNGSVRDVTPWAKFSSTDESVARVTDDGQVEIIGHGEGAISAWYSSKLALGRVTSPFPNEIDAAVFESIPENNFIDTYVNRQLKRLNLRPSPPVDDAQFLRRVYLDSIGRLPSLEETQRFLEDQGADKRERAIDMLLERDEFVDYWSYRLSDILLINGAKLRPDAVKSFYSWIQSNVRQDTPWDEFVRQVITARGSSIENGATNFYALHQDPESMTENICQSFMGLSIACAKCHNHPLEKWTNDQYYGMANLFARVRAKGWGGDPRNGNGIRTVYVETKGDLIQPLRGKPQPPTPLDGSPLPFDAPEDRRDYLADWLTSADNPYFARSITNRIWANYMGVGLVEPVDDMRVSNPASNEQLLDAVAQHLVEQQFDLKSLMKLIMMSAAYQRSSKPLAENIDDQRFYSRYYPKRLMAEVMLDAISDVTDVPTPFNQIVFPGADVAKTDFYPEGTRALELYDSAVKSYFLKTFGRNTRDITCECERSNEPSMVQVLHLSNGETLNGKLRAEKGRITTLIESDATDEEIVDRAFLLCFSRPPTSDERAQLTALLRDDDGSGSDEEASPDEQPGASRRIRVEDLFWSLMTSREFLFNH